jgi:hypothetical protein
MKSRFLSILGIGVVLLGLGLTLAAADEVRLVI